MPIFGGGSEVIEYDGCMLNGEEYSLVKVPAALGMDKRQWQFQAKSRAHASGVQSNIRPGEIDDELVWFQDDWSGGVTSELSRRPNALVQTTGCNGFTPGAVKVNPPSVNGNFGVSPGVVENPDPVLFNGLIFTFQGRYVLQYSAGTVAQDKDFGSGVNVMWALVHNNELVVGFGGSTNKIQVRNTAGTWTAATDAVYFDFATHTGDGNLWRATATSQVSNIGPTGNPRTLSAWSSGITVGQAGNGITALGARGLQLIVAKPEGCFPGDRTAYFQNLLPEFQNQPHPENGKRMLVNGADIFYPHEGGCRRILSDDSVEEVGLQKVMISASPEIGPGARIHGLAADGPYIWATTGLVGYPRPMPTAVLKTTDGTNYTDITSTVTDNDPATSNSVALDTAANNTWLLIGYSSQVLAVFLDIKTPNGTTATLTHAFSAENSPGGPNVWATLGTSLDDHTLLQSLASPATPGGITCAQSGYLITMNNFGVGSSTSAQKTFGGFTLNWLRLTASTAITVGISEIRVITDRSGWLFRGRNAHAEDSSLTSIVWEPYGASYIAAPYARGLGVFSGLYPHRRGAVIVASHMADDNFYQLGPPHGIESGALNFTGTANFVTPRIDFGMPDTTKEFIAIVLKGKTIDSVRDLAVDYRLNTSTTWVSASSSVTTSPTTIALTGVSGYSIQLRIGFNAFTATNDQVTEVNLVEVIARTQETMREEHSVLISIPRDANPSPDVQLTNLGALVNGGAVAYRDPARRSFSAVDVLDMSAAETYIGENGFPALAVQLRLAAQVAAGS